MAAGPSLVDAWQPGHRLQHGCMLPDDSIAMDNGPSGRITDWMGLLGCRIAAWQQDCRPQHDCMPAQDGLVAA